ncbi:MAG: DUF1236 domain-containing protein [Afipia felis]|jgi:hypothetical protein|uniref:Protein of uncharacterized function (DUF1236) n=2 Tax=Afipia felis TaxID=1035 RepID=A0A380W9V8_AFIFE|nr:DUF1236 domain-containing protein [Afipia felis]EKS28985.1 hypothetical protein HMPREF9697_01513 [Afipia felis ATCC 53690]MBN9604283.1 DUF1236 domain-containing protein [Afipia felis]SUU77693.1 Protein of uncharacterised function (DUF1236) [Afipia felis]SUU85758.1 Protein of uncharacterised function (DUF1236) [Afipia felis]
MRKSALVLAVLAGTAAVPAAVQAQGIIVRDGATTGMVVDDGGIAPDLQPRFREYIVQENVPNYTVPGQVMVGVTLPEMGVSYYDVPQQYGAHRYRYTRVNNEYVLVDPSTRRVIQVIE